MKTIIKIYKELKHTIKTNKFRHLWGIIVKDNTSPHEIAIGSAMGVFFSIIPTFSLGMFLSLFVAWKKKYNLLSTYLGTLVVNPINSPFIYFFHYKVGSFILGDQIVGKFRVTPENFLLVAKQVYVGGIFVATISFFVVYFVLFFLVKKYRKIK